MSDPVINMVIEVAPIWGYVVLYSSVGCMAGWATWKLFHPKSPFLDNPLGVITGIFWPIMVPILTPIATVKGFVALSKRGGSLPKFRTGGAAEKKVLDYSQAPTAILTQMICMRIIEHPDGINYRNETFSSQDGKFYITYNGYAHEARSLNRIEFNRKTIVLTKEEQAEILKALTASVKVKKQKEAADAEAARQHAALDIIESELLKPETN